MKKAVILGLLLVVTLTGLGVGREIVVTSTADSGTGSFRWALDTARPGDTITFDPSVFPPENPGTIYPRSELPAISCGHLTIDASNAGVILNGNRITNQGIEGLKITSGRNTVQGLQIIGFSEGGILLDYGARENKIGGDRSIGIGPIGQGNLCSDNSGGIFLRGDGTSYNTITGNLIGTDVTGTEPLGNIDGVVIENGAQSNIIGPDNMIVHNRESGVLIDGGTTSYNTITRNQIYSNGWAGIRFEKTFPGYTDIMLEIVDPATGLIVGHTSAGCVLEFFSDTGLQGAIYEGRTTSNADGCFQLSARGVLSGPNLMATRTDTSGTTGQFVGPLAVISIGRPLQRNNNLPRTPLLARRSEDLEDNRIGDLWGGMWQAPNYQSTFDRYVFGLGVKRIRIAVNSADVLTANWSYPEFRISATYEDLISTLAEHGHKIRYILSFWDKHNSKSQETLPCTRFSTQEDVDRYLTFVRFVIGHLGNRVDAYEIWNEPNVIDCGQRIEVGDYINLVRSVVPVIREATPGAKIVIGSVTPLPFEGAQDYLFKILESDVMPIVDGIAWHVGGPSLEYDEWRDFWLAYPAIVRQIKETAWANGFQGEFIGDELNWRTPLNPHPLGGEPWTYSPPVAAKYFARGIVMERGMDLTVGLALGELEVLPLIVQAIRNLCTTMAGNEAIDMPAQIDINYEPAAYCAFRYPNGDRVLAVWTDGVAQDEDPGVPATITIPGLVAGTVTGIDVLHGFEQELVFKTDGDSTIIRDLLVKDYPILIRLSDVTMSDDYVETVGDGFHRLGNVDAVSSSTGGGSDRDGDGVPDDKDYCPDWPGSKEANGC